MYKRILVMALSLMLVLAMSLLTVFAEETDYGENGRDARSEAMSAEPSESDEVEAGLTEEDVTLEEETPEETRESGVNPMPFAVVSAAGFAVATFIIIKRKRK